MRRLRPRRFAGHGGFLPWIEREFGMSESAANKMMPARSSLSLKWEAPRVGGGRGARGS
jgi:hypothetical protein